MSVIIRESVVCRRSRYQFAWLTDPDTAGNIVMSAVDVPFVFVLDPSNHQFYRPDSPVDQWTVEDMAGFLDGVLEGQYEVSMRCFLVLDISGASIWLVSVNYI